MSGLNDRMEFRRVETSEERRAYLIKRAQFIASYESLKAQARELFDREGKLSGDELLERMKQEYPGKVDKTND